MRKLINQFDAQGARTSMATPSCCCCCSCVGTLFATSAWVALRVDDALALSEASENQQILPEGQVPVGSKRKKYFWMTLLSIPFILVIASFIAITLPPILIVYPVIVGYLLHKKVNLPIKSIFGFFAIVSFFIALEFGISLSSLELGPLVFMLIPLLAIFIYLITHWLYYRINHDKIRAVKHAIFITGFFVVPAMIFYFAFFIQFTDFSGLGS